MNNVKNQQVEKYDIAIWGIILTGFIAVFGLPTSLVITIISYFFNLAPQGLNYIQWGLVTLICFICFIILIVLIGIVGRDTDEKVKE